VLSQNPVSNVLGLGTMSPQTPLDLRLGGGGSGSVVSVGNQNLGTFGVLGFSTGPGLPFVVEGNPGDDLVLGASLIERLRIVAAPKAMTLASPGFANLFSIHITGTDTAGGQVHYTIRATDGGSQIATESGIIEYVAAANSAACQVQPSSTIHLGTVNSSCSVGFFDPGFQPGVSIYDNVKFTTPAAIAVNEVIFTIENESGSAIRLEP